jgi:hypothetical protein
MFICIGIGTEGRDREDYEIKFWFLDEITAKAAKMLLLLAISHTHY